MAEKEENKQVNLFKSSLETGFSKPKTLDTSALEEQIQKISTPTSSNVYDKLAALYRQETQGRSLRETTDLQRVFLPAIDLYQTRVQEADERFQELQDQIPTFDDSVVYGEKTENGVGFEDQITGVSNEIRNDMRLLSRLNPNDPRYNELSKKIRQKQNKIISFNEVNQKLLDIRNMELDPSRISNGYSDVVRKAYQAIALGETDNIGFNEKGILVYTDPVTSEVVDLTTLDANPTAPSDAAREIDANIRSTFIEFYDKGGRVYNDDGSFTVEYNNSVRYELEKITRLKNSEIKSLIFDGATSDDDLYGGINTREFIATIISENPELFEDVEEGQEMNTLRNIKVSSTDGKIKYKGKETTLRKAFEVYYKDKIHAIGDSFDKSTRRKIENKNDRTVRNTLLKQKGFTVDDFTRDGFYNKITKYVDLAINDQLETVYIPKEDIPLAPEFAESIGLQDNVLKQGESYYFADKSVLQLVDQQIQSNLVRSGDDVFSINMKKAEKFTLKGVGGSYVDKGTNKVMVKLRRTGAAIDANDFVKAVRDAGFEIKSSADLIMLSQFKKDTEQADLERFNKIVEAAKKYGINIRANLVPNYLKLIYEIS
tara:strand:- start:24 stop:1823 length:1800 start_codon:yes stop_codon:yes gene_type:complete